jgi:hypothetical protein
VNISLFRLHCIERGMRTSENNVIAGFAAHGCACPTPLAADGYLLKLLQVYPADFLDYHGNSHPSFLLDVPPLRQNHPLMPGGFIPRVFGFHSMSKHLFYIQ